MFQVKEESIACAVPGERSRCDNGKRCLALYLCLTNLEEVRECRNFRVWDFGRSMERETIEVLDRAGVSFTASVDVPGGGINIVLDPDELPEFVNDKDGFAAKRFGVSKELYRQWVDSDGTVQCSARTTTGARCRNMVSGPVQQDIKEWLKMLGTRCAVHGGEESYRK